MNRTLTALIVLGLFQVGIATAQDDGFGGRHGRQREARQGDGVDSPRVERARDGLDQGAQPANREEVRQDDKRIKGSSGRHRAVVAPRTSANQNPQGQRSQGNRFSGQGNFPANGNQNRANSGNNSRPGTQARDMGATGRFQGNPGNRTAVRTPPARIQRLGVRSVPEPIRDHSRILVADRHHSTITPPSRDAAGRALTARPFTNSAISGKIVRTHMNTIVGNASFTAQINIYDRTENRRNNYYWHTTNGLNYCHYYDNWGYHWYGWYLGPQFFWTRWYGNNWWWYDSTFDRWCYWHDGGWWWQDPFHVNVVYVYNNGDYTACDTAPSSNFGNDNGQVVYQSNDGSRKVKVMGDGRDAFLYDATGGNSFEPIYLASGVKEVKFSNTENNRPLQVMLTLQDGSFELFDAYGNRYQGGD